jgi:hypothetical protein
MIRGGYFDLLYFQLVVFFRKVAVPHCLLRQRCVIRDIAALSELNNLPLAVDLFYYSKRSICEVHITLRKVLVAACPTNGVHKATLVPIAVRNAKRVDKAVLEWGKCPCKTGIEGPVQAKRAIEVVMCVVEREADVLGE